MTDSPEAAEQARSGIRAMVRSAGGALRRSGPYGVYAFLVASTVAPIAGAALGTSPEYAAALGQLGSMGSNFLADALAGAAARARGRDGDAWRDAIAAELLERLEGGDTGLRDEIGELLHAVGAVDTALRAADEGTREAIAVAFSGLSELAYENRRVLEELRRDLAAGAEEQRRTTEQVLRALAAATTLTRAVRPESPQPAPGGGHDGVAPYPGLTSFDVGDAAFFHGRDRLVRTLLGRLDDHLLGGPPVVVTGDSGVGKSSLLRAGLLPAIAADGLGEGSGDWPWVVLTPGPEPLTGLRAALGPEPQRWRIVVVDQFEELFTQCPDERERAAFVEALVAAPRTLLIISVRSDFYPRCAELPPMAALLAGGQVVVGPMDAGELREAVVEPARRAGLTLEPGLVELLLRDYRPGALPLLAHALRATYERREGDTLTVAGYQRTGGIARAVAETAEGVYAGLDARGREALRSALLGLVTVVDGLVVRRRATRDEVDAEVLRPLVARRLVTAGDDTVELSHEALLDGWPRLAGWLADARDEIRIRRRLAQDAEDWAAAGEDPDLLYRGARLASVVDAPAGPLQQRFVGAAREAEEAREQERFRGLRRLRRLAGGLAVALLLAVAGGLVALGQRGEAQEQRALAVSRLLAAEARGEHFADPISSVRKALGSWSAAPTAEARSALMYAQQTTLRARLGTRTGARAVAVSTDAHLVAAGYPGGDIELWDAVTQTRTGPVLHHPSKDLRALAFSPDGRYLASSGLGFDTPLTIWDVRSGAQLHRLPGAGPPAWLPDSSAVLAARIDLRTVAIGSWDPATGSLTASIPSPRAPLFALDVDATGTRLAAADRDGGAVLRRADGKVLTLVPGASTLGFAADGTLFSTATLGGKPVQARREADGWKPTDLNDLADPGPPPFGDLAVTPDGTAIIGTQVNGRIVRLTRGGPRLDLSGFTTIAADMEVSGDGLTLALVGERDVPTLIDVGAAALPHPQLVGYQAYDATGERLATGSHDPVIRIWDPATSALRATIPLDSPEGPLGLAYAKDGTLAALAGGKVLLFDRENRPRRTLSTEPGTAPGGLAFSPDGSLIAATIGPAEEKVDFEWQRRDDVDVLVWDAATGELRARLRLPGVLPTMPVFTPDGRNLLVSSSRSLVEDRSRQAGGVWRFSVPGFALAESRAIGEGVGNNLVVSPDSTQVALPAGTTTRVLSVEGLEPVRAVGRHPAPVAWVAWSPDGRTLASSSDTADDLIRLWDPATGDAIADLRGNSNARGQLRFSPDGRTLSAGLNDWTVGIWRLSPADAVTHLCTTVVAACP
jgi:WD40 repeat protein